MYEVDRLTFVMALTKARESGNVLLHPHDLPGEASDEICYTLTPDEKHGKVWFFDGFEETWVPGDEF